MRPLESLMLTLLLAGCAAVGGQATAVDRAKPLSSEGHSNLSLAQIYLQNKDVAKATFHAKAAVASDPGSGLTHAVMAMIHATSGDQKKAAKEFDRALRIAPTDGAILNSHATWLCDMGQFDQADAEYAQAVLDPRYITPLQALNNAGACAHKAGQFAKAEGYFRRVLAVSPRDSQALLLIADATLRQRKILEAQAFIQRRDALGSDIATLVLAARIEDAANNRLAAARYRQRLKEEFPNYVPTGEGARSP
jgi:type IV pilus assembly protein PilF